MHYIRTSHWHRFSKALAKIFGGGMKTSIKIQRLIDQARYLKKNAQLTPPQARKISRSLIWQSAIMADNLDQARRETGNSSNWDAFFIEALKEIEKRVPTQIKSEMHRQTIPKQR